MDPILQQQMFEMLQSSGIDPNSDKDLREQLLAGSRENLMPWFFAVKGNKHTDVLAKEFSKYQDAVAANEGAYQNALGKFEAAEQQKYADWETEKARRTGTYNTLSDPYAGYNSVWMKQNQYDWLPLSQSGGYVSAYRDFFDAHATNGSLQIVEKRSPFTTRPKGAYYLDELPADAQQGYWIGKNKLGYDYYQNPTLPDAPAPGAAPEFQELAEPASLLRAKKSQKKVALMASLFGQYK